jgi:NDP-sugar pyrophosphorylase family protein
MLLAAGLGTRMAPLTPSWPKPALPILDQPLLLRLARGLAAQGIESIVVNAHDKAEAFEAILRESPVPTALSLEPILRGSGGGILGARRFLENSERFLVLNADMCIDLDVPALLDAHIQSGARVTLALRDDSRKAQFGTIGYAEDGSVCRITDLVDRGAETGCGLFTGAQVMESTILDDMPDCLEFNLVSDFYCDWVREGRRITSWLQPLDAIWWPVGNPCELLAANLNALEQSLAAGATDTLIADDAVIEGQVRGPAWIGARARIPRGARVGPRVVIGAGAALPEWADVEESLLLPGARPLEGKPLRRTIAFGERLWTDG